MLGCFFLSISDNKIKLVLEGVMLSIVYVFFPQTKALTFQDLVISLSKHCEINLKRFISKAAQTFVTKHSALLQIHKNAGLL